MSNPASDLWNTLLQDFLLDVKQDVLPDAQNVLTIVEQGGYQALLLPQNQLVLQSFLIKAQADALAAGNDLSKQVATLVSQWLNAKFTSLTTPASGVA